MARFKRHRIDILISTNLASRGLDVEGLKCVVNYDAPSTIVDYEHRIGRTGRMGRHGQAITFITDADSELLPDLKAFLIKKKQKIPHELQSHPRVIQADESIIH